jgi:glycosyltransferase involved in cell wall biosynthesis
MLARFLVIMPTYRRPDYLPNAVRSALHQAGADVRIVVVDDCPDGSAEAQVKAMADSRVTYLRTPQPTGGWPGKVRNYGFDFAQTANIQGDFVHFLDDDDLVPEGHYAAVAEAFAEHQDIGVVFGIVEPFVAFSEDHHVRALQDQKLRHERAYFARAARAALTYRWLGLRVPYWGRRTAQALFKARALFGPPLFVCSAVVIRREHVVALNGFDPDIRLMEDNEFYARAVQRFGVYFINRIALKYRVGSASALMHSLNLRTEDKAKEEQGIREGIGRKNAKLRKELGTLNFYLGKLSFYLLLSPCVTFYGIRRRILGQLRKFSRGDK